MEDWKFYPMTMHLHCDHQPKASMESHLYNAASLGMKYIRFTPHDILTGPVKHVVRSFDFTQGSASYKDESGRFRYWIPAEGSDVSFDAESMNLFLQAPEDNELHECSAMFNSDGERQTVSLLADVTLTLELDAKFSKDACVVVDVKLSQRPPDHDFAHMFYYLCENNETPILEEKLPPHTAVINLLPKENGVYHLRISEDAKTLEHITGGLDNAFTFLHIRAIARNGGSVLCRVRKLNIDVQKSFEEEIAEQRKLGDRLGARYGIKPFITTEISGAGHHKNYYSETVPVIDYAAAEYDITHMEAIAHVKKHGGIFSYNHPFDKYKRKTLNQEERHRIIEKKAAYLTAARVYGATLIEIGFPDGRHGFLFEDYLRLWDLLSLTGVFITGCGDSDSHCSDEDWFEGNNFATWIAADPTLSFPISDAVFIESMQAGRAYLGDPVWLKGEIELTEKSSNSPMGAILLIEDRDKQPRTLTFSAQSVQKDWRVRVIADGELLEEHIIEQNGNFQCCFDVIPLLPVSFVRVEMYNSNGRCILLTNPIYLVRTSEFAGNIPSHRLYNSFLGL